MIRFAIRHMATRWVRMALAVLSIVLSCGVALLAFNVSSQVEDGIVNTAGYYDVIIGPSGSATQLAMNTMFFTDQPLGTLPWDVVEELQSNPQVNEAVPFTMGDSYNSARIVGTSQALLNGKPLAEGRLFEEAMECVVGSAVAEKYQLALGAELVSSHGLSTHGASHAATPFCVVGILEETGTAFDNQVFTACESVWAVHDHGDEDAQDHAGEEDHHHEEGEVCAILLRTKSMNAFYKITEYYGEQGYLAINPSTVLREVLDNVDVTRNIVYLLSGVILAMNLFVIAVITALNLYDAKPEIELMRLIGIGLRKINRLFLLENGIAAILSGCLAFAASRVCLLLMGEYVASQGIVLSWKTVYPLEWAIMAAVLLVSVLPTVLLTDRMSRKDGIGS